MMDAPGLLVVVVELGVATLGALVALGVRDLWVRGRDAEARFREFADALPHVVFTTDAAGVVTFMNREFTALTGASTGGALERRYLDFIHPDDHERFRSRWNAALTTGAAVTMEYRLSTTDGHRWRQLRLVPVRAPDGRLTGWHGTAIDIDEMKRDAARLREQAMILERVREGIVVRDLDHRVLYWNRGAERLYGWTAAEVRGRPVTQFLYRDAPEAHAAMATVLATGVWHGRLLAHGRDGARVEIEAYWTLVRDDTGEPTSVIAIHIDLTERLALQERLQQAMRLESIGELSGGLAHDFNNLLTVILGNSELLVGRLGGDPRLRALAEMTRDAAQRGAALTQRMLAFARRQVLEPTAVDIGALLHELRPILSSALRDDIVLTIEAADGLPACRADRTQLANAIMSLCVNARDAMPHGGRVRIGVTDADLSDDAAAGARDLAPGRYMRIDIADTGSGIAPELLGRVFDPFFTTKRRDKGTGLGLSMVYGFARQSAGHASIASVLGEGTTVSLLLPVAPPAPAAASPVRPAADEARGETILVTEDDEFVREFVCEQIRTLGYVVLSARDGGEAMAILEQGRPVDLLFTDIVMPGRMNGRQLAEAARALRPGLAILYTSGYPDDGDGSEGRIAPGAHLLGKPYRRAELAQKLRAALASRGPTAQGSP